MELAIIVEVFDLANEPARSADDPAGSPRQSVTVEPVGAVGFSFTDLAVAALFALIIGILIWNVQRSMDARFFAAPAGNDVWFEADLPTVADTVLHRWSTQSRNARHPLFPLL